MNIIARLMGKLRSGTATPDEIENLDRRLFCLGAAASAGGLIARPAIVDFAPGAAPLPPLPAWLEWTLGGAYVAQAAMHHLHRRWGT